MDKKMKNHYQVPTIKVVAFKVEMGQMASPPPTNLNIGFETSTSRTDGTQLFGIDDAFSRSTQPSQEGLE